MGGGGKGGAGSVIAYSSSQTGDGGEGGGGVVESVVRESELKSRKTLVFHLLSGGACMVRDSFLDTPLSVCTTQHSSLCAR